MMSILERLAGAMGYTLVPTDKVKDDEMMMQSMMEESEAIGELKQIMDEPEETLGQTMRKLEKVKEVVDGLE